MVCKSCEKKLRQLATPEVWKAGARDGRGGGGKQKKSATLLATNKLLQNKKKGNPYGQRCTVCRQQLHQDGKFCQTCAYAKGVCSMCGIQIADVAMHRQSEGAGHLARVEREKKAEQDNAVNQKKKKKKTTTTQTNREESGGGGRGGEGVQAEGGGKGVEMMGWESVEGRYYDRKSNWWYDPQTSLYYHDTHSGGQWVKEPAKTTT